MGVESEKEERDRETREEDSQKLKKCRGEREREHTRVTHFNRMSNVLFFHFLPKYL